MFYICLADRPLQIYTTSSNKRFLNSSVYPAAQCVRQKASLEVFLFSYAFFLLFALCTDCLSPPSFAFVLFFKNFGYEFLVPFPFLNCRPIPPLGLGTTRFSFAFFFFILSNITIKKNIFVSFSLPNSIYAPPSSFSFSLSNYQKPAKPFPFHILSRFLYPLFHSHMAMHSSASLLILCRSCAFSFRLPCLRPSFCASILPSRLSLSISVNHRLCKMFSPFLHFSCSPFLCRLSCFPGFRHYFTANKHSLSFVIPSGILHKKRGPIALFSVFRLFYCFFTAVFLLCMAAASPREDSSNSIQKNAVRFASPVCGVVPSVVFAVPVSAYANA